MIADHDTDRRQSAGSRRRRFNDATTAANQDSFPSGAGRDAAYDTPRHGGDESNANDEYNDPVKRPGNANEVVKLFRRCGSLQRNGTKYPLR